MRCVVQAIGECEDDGAKEGSEEIRNRSLVHLLSGGVEDGPGKEGDDVGRRGRSGVAISTTLVSSFDKRIRGCVRGVIICLVKT